MNTEKSLKRSGARRARDYEKRVEFFSGYGSGGAAELKSALFREETLREIKKAINAVYYGALNVEREKTERYAHEVATLTAENTRLKEEIKKIESKPMNQ